MGQRQIVITYQNAGTQPPVFVAGTFSDPAWQPQEMSPTPDASGEYTFEKVISAQAGTELQYKFRLGTGDWWVCDDTVAKSTDHEGNVNNVLRINSLSIDEGDFEGEEDDSDESGPPMFSHECFGSHEVSPNAPVTPDDGLPSPSDNGLRLPHPIDINKDFDSAIDDIDYNDPRLERFPHENRRSIIAELQRIETSTEPDRSLPDGITPVSPILTSPHTSLFSSSYSAALEPEPTNRRTNGSRASIGSFHSHASLASINETAEEETEEDKAPRPSVHTSNPPPVTFDTTDYKGADGSQYTSSRSVSQEEPETPSVRLEAPSDDEDEGISLSTGNSVKKPGSGHIRKRETRSPAERPKSPASVSSVHEVSKRDGWIKSILRVVFVDWIGGFLSNLLLGSRRKALFALGTTILCVGLYWGTAAVTRNRWILSQYATN